MKRLILFISIGLVLVKNLIAIPNIQRKSDLRWGVGFPSIVHGSVQTFFPIGPITGIGFGLTAHAVVTTSLESLFVYYPLTYQSNFSLALLYEKMFFKHFELENYGLGLHMPTPIGRLEANVLFSNRWGIQKSLSSGVEISQPNGFFYGFLFHPSTVYMGWQLFELNDTF